MSVTNGWLRKGDVRTPTTGIGLSFGHFPFCKFLGTLPSSFRRSALCTV
jgi:hypothetical protein